MPRLKNPDSELDFDRSLDVFTLRREELLRVLRGLSEERWGKSAVIEGRTHSVFSQARRLALHELEHRYRLLCRQPAKRCSTVVSLFARPLGR
jgi:hypothetical protein